MKTDVFNKVLLQNILHNIDIGIHVIDENRKTIVYNEAMSRIEGLDAEYVLNKDLLEVFPSLDERSSTLISALTEKKPIMDKAQIYINSKGQKIFSINSTIPIFVKDKVVAAMEIAKDVTYVKELSEKLIDLQNELKLNNKAGSYKKKNRIKRYNFSDIVARDENMIRAIEIARRASNSPSSVLIYGETGTGKELFAQSIHYSGDRKDKHFIAQNCAAIPETLLEGILFGTDKGGFTGAVEREGIFEQANGGTLLLDEINSMSHGLQAKLLRVLQEGYIRRIGGVKDIPIDVKIIATTNEDPLVSIENGRIRKDLYYRLNVVYLRIPPLRERKDDIELLANHFINKYNYILNRNILGISDRVLEAFHNYSWPGNVRELENSIESAMNYAPSDRRYLMEDDFITCSNIFSNDDTTDDEKFKVNKPLPYYLEDIEKKIILGNLKENRYNISQTAKKLGIKRQTLQHKLKKYSIKAK